MKKELLSAKRGTPLRKSGVRKLDIIIKTDDYENIFLINGIWFITKITFNSDLIIQPHDYFMVINNTQNDLEIDYTEDISKFDIIYDPYKYEEAEKIDFKAEYFKEKYDVSDGYTDTLPKWYSFKYTYPDHNLIFIKPELGISIQTHDQRNENWEIIDGKPIIINGNNVYYFVKSGTKFDIPINTYHSVINPNPDKFVILKEQWSGEFDEEDIKRLFNPNQYK